jgi:hypothetical protein
METYTYYPPQVHSTQSAYYVLVAGTKGCAHELLDEDWRDRISVQDGIVFITYTCKACGRQICQSLEEAVPPATWKGGNSNYSSLFFQQVPNPLASIGAPSWSYQNQFSHYQPKGEKANA